MRLIGFIAGALLTGLVVWVTGSEWPHDAAAIGTRFDKPAARAADDRIPRAGTSGPREQPVAAAMAVADTAGVPQMIADGLAARDRHTAGDAAVIQQDTVGPEPEPAMAPPAAGDSGDDEPDPGTGLGTGDPDPGDERWLAFFTPFRSEASATGFARHLEASTGRRFRVTREGPGDYRVEFLVDDEEDEAARLDEIEAVSGLALRAGRL